MPTRAKPRSKRVTRKAAKTPRRKAVLAELVELYRQKRAVGRKFYVAAGELLEAIVKRMRPGRRVPLDGGVYGVLVDKFAESNQSFKSVYVQRYELQIVDADGKEVRLRDRKRARGRKAKPQGHGTRKFF